MDKYDMILSCIKSCSRYTFTPNNMKTLSFIIGSLACLVSANDLEGTLIVTSGILSGAKIRITGKNDHRRTYLRLAYVDSCDITTVPPSDASWLVKPCDRNISNVKDGNLSTLKYPILESKFLKSQAPRSIIYLDYFNNTSLTPIIQSSIIPFFRMDNSMEFEALRTLSFERSTQTISAALQIPYTYNEAAALSSPVFLTEEIASYASEEAKITSKDPLFIRRKFRETIKMLDAWEVLPEDLRFNTDELRKQIVAELNNQTAAELIVDNEFSSNSSVPIANTKIQNDEGIYDEGEEYYKRALSDEDTKLLTEINIRNVIDKHEIETQNDNTNANNIFTITSENSYYSNNIQVIHSNTIESKSDSASVPLGLNNNLQETQNLVNHNFNILNTYSSSSHDVDGLDQLNGHNDINVIESIIETPKDSSNKVSNSNHRNYEGDSKDLQVGSGKFIPGEVNLTMALLSQLLINSTNSEILNTDINKIKVQRNNLISMDNTDASLILSNAIMSAIEASHFGNNDSLTKLDALNEDRDKSVSYFSQLFGLITSMVNVFVSMNKKDSLSFESLDEMLASEENKLLLDKLFRDENDESKSIEDVAMIALNSNGNIKSSKSKLIFLHQIFSNSPSFVSSANESSDLNFIVHRMSHDTVSAATVADSSSNSQINTLNAFEKLKSYDKIQFISNLATSLAIRHLREVSCHVRSISWPFLLISIVIWFALFAANISRILTAQRRRVSSSFTHLVMLILPAIKAASICLESLSYANCNSPDEWLGIRLGAAFVESFFLVCLISVPAFILCQYASYCQTPIDPFTNFSFSSERITPGVLALHREPMYVRFFSRKNQVSHQNVSSNSMNLIINEISESQRNNNSTDNAIADDASTRLLISETSEPSSHNNICADWLKFLTILSTAERIMLTMNILYVTCTIANFIDYIHGSNVMMVHVHIGFLITLLIISGISEKTILAEVNLSPLNGQQLTTAGEVVWRESQLRRLRTIWRIRRFAFVALIARILIWSVSSSFGEVAIHGVLRCLIDPCLYYLLYKLFPIHSYNSIEGLARIRTRSVQDSNSSTAPHDRQGNLIPLFSALILLDSEGNEYTPQHENDCETKDINEDMLTNWISQTSSSHFQGLTSQQDRLYIEFPVNLPKIDLNTMAFLIVDKALQSPSLTKQLCELAHSPFKLTEHCLHQFLMQIYNMTHASHLTPNCSPPTGEMLIDKYLKLPPTVLISNPSSRSPVLSSYNDVSVDDLVAMGPSPYGYPGVRNSDSNRHFKDSENINSKKISTLFDYNCLIVYPCVCDDTSAKAQNIHSSKNNFSFSNDVLNVISKCESQLQKVGPPMRLSTLDLASPIAPHLASNGKSLKLPSWIVMEETPSSILSCATIGFPGGSFLPPLEAEILAMIVRAMLVDRGFVNVFHSCAYEKEDHVDLNNFQIEQQFTDLQPEEAVVFNCDSLKVNDFPVSICASSHVHSVTKTLSTEAPSIQSNNNNFNTEVDNSNNGLNNDPDNSRSSSTLFSLSSPKSFGFISPRSPSRALSYSPLRLHLLDEEDQLSFLNSPNESSNINNSHTHTDENINQSLLSNSSSLIISSPESSDESLPPRNALPSGGWFHNLLSAVTSYSYLSRVLNRQNREVEINGIGRMSTQSDFDTLELHLSSAADTKNYPLRHDRPQHDEKKNCKRRDYLEDLTNRSAKSLLEMLSHSRLYVSSAIPSSIPTATQQRRFIHDGNENANNVTQTSFYPNEEVGQFNSHHSRTITTPGSHFLTSHPLAQPVGDMEETLPAPSMSSFEQASTDVAEAASDYSELNYPQNYLNDFQQQRRNSGRIINILNMEELFLERYNNNRNSEIQQQESVVSLTLPLRDHRFATSELNTSLEEVADVVRISMGSGDEYEEQNTLSLNQERNVEVIIMSADHEQVIYNYRNNNNNLSENDGEEEDTELMGVATSVSLAEGRWNDE